ncbi:MAG: hypothetical protein ACOCP8_06290 [archaeon]
MKKNKLFFEVFQIGKEKFIILSGITYNMKKADQEFAKILNLSTKKYRSILLKKFNGKRSKWNGIIFNNEKDANKAKEWIENNIIMMIKLVYEPQKIKHKI